MNLTKEQTEQELVFALVFGYLSDQSGETDAVEMANLLFYSKISGFNDLIQEGHGKIFVSDNILKKAMKVMSILHDNPDVNLDCALEEGKKMIDNNNL